MNFVAVVVAVSGNARAARANGSVDDLRPGAQLALADAVFTDAGASVRFAFHDGSEISLGPETRIEIREFAFDPSGESEPSFWVHMATGLVRSVSGKVVEQNPEAFKLSAPLGVVGIRGTTTLHEIRDSYEVHSVVELSEGHIVVVTTRDGRSVIITDQLNLVRLHIDGEMRLTPEELSRDVLDGYLQLLLASDRLRDGQQGLYIIGGVETLGWLGTDQFGGLSSSMPPSMLDGLSDVMGGHGMVGGESLVLSHFIDRVGGGTGAALPPFWAGPPSAGTGPGAGSGGGSGPAAQANHIDGTVYNDFLVGSAGNEYIRGFKGDDTINSGLGQDTVFGGYGSTDTLIKPGLMDDGNYFYGDDETLSGGAVGDGDLITVAAMADYGAGDMTGGVIYGDARLIDGASGGDDSIVIEGEMSGGVIYGDAEEMRGAAVAGNDLISIAIMSGGRIYADAASGVHAGGNDTIRVGGFADGGDILIDGGAGANTLVFANDENNHILLDAASFSLAQSPSGSARTRDVAWKNIQTFMSGAGNDTFIVAMSDFSGAILSGAGDDSFSLNIMSGGRLEGGAGNETFTINEFSGGEILAQAGGVSASLGVVSGGVFTGGTGLDSMRIGAMTSGSVTGSNGSDLDGFSYESSAYSITRMEGGSITACTAAQVAISRMSGGSFATFNPASLAADTNDTSYVVINEFSGGSFWGGDWTDQLVIGKVTGSGSITLAGGQGKKSDMSGQDYDFLSFTEAGAINAEFDFSQNRLSFKEGSVVNTHRGAIALSGFELIYLPQGEHTLSLTDMDGIQLYCNGSQLDDTLSTGFNNRVEITALLAESSVTGDTVYSDPGQTGGYDTITANVVNGGSIVGDFTYLGDYYETESRYTRGGDDLISVGSLAAGSLIGDAGNTMSYYSRGGNDTIRVAGDMTGGSISGDAYTSLSNNARGGDDLISVGGDFLGGTISGDAHNSFTGRAGGNDTIIIEGRLDGGKVYGDAGNSMGGANGLSYEATQGGNDEISVAVFASGTIAGDAPSMGFFGASPAGGDDSIGIGVMTGGSVFGDAASMYSTASGGCDSIDITLLSEGLIAGDGKSVGAGYEGNDTVTCGNDTVTVGTMNGGTIYGDAQTLGGHSTAGSDSIHVDIFNGGFIYGDAGSVRLNAIASGNDSIFIGSVGGTSPKEIRGGGGDDIFTFGGKVHDDGAILSIGDFLDGDDVLDLRAFGAGNVTQTVENDGVHLTCRDGLSGNSMTIILHDLDQELLAHQLLLTT